MPERLVNSAMLLVHGVCIVSSNKKVREMIYSKHLIEFVEEVNAATMQMGEDDFGPYGHVSLFDSELAAEPLPSHEWGYWDDSCVLVSFGCSSMSVNLAENTFRAWHETADDDPVSAIGRGLEYPQPYTVYEGTDEGQLALHNCIALPGKGNDEQVSALFAALSLWVSGDLKINYLPLSEDDKAHYLCSPDPEGIRALHLLLASLFKKCVELNCSGAGASADLLSSVE